MTRRPARLAVASLAALLAAGCTGTTSGDDRPGRPRLVADECADLVVVGARGSTQDPRRNLGVGTEVRMTVQALVRRLHRSAATTVRIEPIRYDASATATLPAYQDHVAEGARMMGSRLRRLARACPDSRFALVGFSQGAQVVHASAAGVPATLAARVDLVAMIADPRQNPGDAIRRYGYAARPVSGNGRLGSGPPIDENLRDVAISFCVEGDEICNDRGAPGGPPSATHRTFYERPSTARRTAAQLADILQR